MLKILGKMFGDADVVKKAADGIYNGLDKAIFTKEEKAEFNQKRMELYLKFVEATAPYKIARRYIAIVITCVWALLVVACAILGAIGGFDYQGAAQAAEFIFKLLNEVVHWAILSVLGFYFGDRFFKK